MFKQAVVLSYTLIIFTVVPSFAADYIDKTTGMEFVKIPAGTFTMGDPSGNDTDASPAREVTVTEFYLGKHEVTFQQYDKFCEATGRDKPSDEGWGRGNRPVINVDWQDAVAFTEWLSKETGLTYRLPSETEWEYAVRGGTKTTYWWGDEWQEMMGVCRECGTEWDGRQTTSVGSFKPNPYGLFDMTGNVYEWLLDVKHTDYVETPSTAEPRKKSGQPSMRMVRGGSWRHDKNEFISFARCWDNMEGRNNDTGFRVVMEP